MERKDYNRLLVKYGLNNPFLVGKKRNKHCVFVYNPKTKRINAVYFDKFDVKKNIKVTSKNLKNLSVKNGKLKEKKNPTDKDFLNKKFWANEFLNSKWNMKKAKNFKKYKIKKGKIEKGKKGKIEKGKKGKIEKGKK